MTFVGLPGWIVVSLLAATAGVLAALQLLRTRPRTLRVNTTIFWSEALQASRASTLWRRFRYPLTYLLELLVNPVFVALLGLVAAPGRLMAVALAGTLTLKAGLAAAAERRLEVRRPLAAYPLLELARSLLVGLLWVVPLVHSSVCWRGNALRVRRHGWLEPAAPVWHGRRRGDQPDAAAEGLR